MSIIWMEKLVVWDTGTQNVVFQATALPGNLLATEILQLYHKTSE